MIPVEAQVGPDRMLEKGIQGHSNPTSSILIVAVVVVIHAHVRLDLPHNLQITQPSGIHRNVENSVLHLGRRHYRGKESLSKTVPQHGSEIRLQ